MTRRLALLIAASPALLAAASVPVGEDRELVDVEIKRAQTEAKAAEAEVKRLEQAAGQARDEAARLAAEQQAAAAAITESEAKISAADGRARLAEALVADREARLARRQAPVAALLAGIVSMGRRPPLLGMADARSIDEFVRVRALLDTTLPVIRARSAALSGELAESRRLRASAIEARQALAAARKQLEQRQQQFAALETKASQRAERLGAGAVGASDVLIASGETERELRSAANRRSSGLRLAADLGALPAAVPRPGAAKPAKPPIQYRLPVPAAVTYGFAAVDRNGIRSRGLTLAAFAGQQVLVPAGGTIAFAGPFRRHDGVVIIDHGDGWMTLLTGVRTQVAKGGRVQQGDVLGRALGPVSVELSTNGTPVSSAIIAGSSQQLFIGGKSG
jgi:septal ring factor EnvC (AmiA/AmiB activator)